MTDANTGAGVDRRDRDQRRPPGGDARRRSATPDDPNLGDGFYWMFSPLTGRHKLTATHDGYASKSKTVNIGGDATTRVKLKLSPSGM